MNPRKLSPAVDALLGGGVIISPTDSVYSFLCIAGDKSAINRLRQIKGIANDHPLSLHCKDISQASQFAVVDQTGHRLLKRYCPGPYTIILPAKRDITKTLRQKRQEVGVRISNHALLSHLLASVDQPLISTSVSMKSQDDEQYDYVESSMIDLEDIAARYLSEVDVLVDVGTIPNQLTTVLQFVSGEVTCLRQGIGPV